MLYKPERKYPYERRFRDDSRNDKLNYLPPVLEI